MNVANIINCYGCGVCSTICPKDIIEIKLNKNGFYEPYISHIEKCVNCNLCVDVCSFMSDKLSLKNDRIKSYAAWSKDEKIRKKCSSGGIGFEIAKTLILKGYKVCAVKYNVEKNIAEHYIASTVNELLPSIGSKYIQSYTVDGFKCINKKEKYLVTGTPCQIDSFRRYIQKRKIEDNFILLDFFCHGVPSMLMWEKYIKYVEKKIGKITYVSWRNKFTSWHDSWAMSLDGDKNSKAYDWKGSYVDLMKEKKGTYNSRYSQKDLFYTFFLNDTCLGKACYENCKFKYKNSSADIRIGDLWGTTYKEDRKGVSAVVIYTEIGEKILNLVDCDIIEHPFEVVAEGQMKSMPIFHKEYIIIRKLLKIKSINLLCIYRVFTIIRIYIKLMNKLKKYISWK